MLKNTLAPTNGSETSAQTIRKTRCFAKSIQTDIAGLYVTDKFPGFSNQAQMLVDTKEKSMGNAVTYIQKFLNSLASTTRETAKHKKFGMKPAEVNIHISLK
jgi:hypothetical protein